MNNKVFLIIPVIFILFMGGFLIWFNMESNKLEGNIETYRELKAEYIETRNAKIIEFIQSISDSDAEILYQESDSNLHVVKADSDIYKVKYNEELEDIDYVMHGDKIVYELSD